MKTKPKIVALDSVGTEIEKIEKFEQEAEYAEKTVAYFEKSFAGSAVDTVQGGESGAWSPEEQAFLDATTLKSLFFSEDWVYIVVDLIANKISSQRLKVMKEEIDDEGNVSTTYDDVHPLNDLLDQPNQWQDYHSWMYNLCVEYFLEGNAIIWYARQKNSLTVFPTELVSIDFHTDGNIRSYLVGSNSEEGRMSQDNRVTFDQKEIAHIRRPNPSSLLWGLSPFIPGRKSILFNRYSQDYLNAFYQKQATPGLALKMDKNVNEDVALRQLRSFEQAYTGRRNQRRTMIVPKGVDVVPLSHTLADQRIVEVVDKNREVICALLKVPKHELSLQSAGSLGSEEHKTSLKNFWEATLKPAMRMIEGSLTGFFKLQLGEGRFLEFDLTDVQALQEDKVQQAELAKKLLESGWSVNEVRRDLFEKAPSSQADADLPFNLIAKSAPPPMAFSATAPTTLAEPQVETEPLEIQTEDEELPDVGIGAGDKVMRYMAKFDGYLDTVRKQLKQEEVGTGLQMQDLVLETFAAFAEQAIMVITTSLKEKSFKAVDAPAKRTLQRRIQRAFDDLEEQFVNKHSQILSSTIDVGYRSQLDVVVNGKDRNEIAALQERDAKGRSLQLSERGIDTFAQISKTQSESIMSDISKGVENNETIDQIARRVADTFRDPEKSLAKARTIARTETLTAVSLGQAAAMDNAKEVLGPELRKAWISADDGDVRDSHTQAQEAGAIPADDAFPNGLNFPRDPAGGPEETINCRCTLVMIPPGVEFDEI